MDISKLVYMYNNFRGYLTSTIGATASGGGGYGTIIHLPDGSPQPDIDAANAILDGYDQMAVVSDVATITADGADIATITATAGAGDTQIRFDVWDSEDDHAVTDEGVAVAGGQAQYQFSTALAETYKVFAYGDVSYKSGNVEVTANDA